MPFVHASWAGYFPFPASKVNTIQTCMSVVLKWCLPLSFCQVSDYKQGTVKDNIQRYYLHGYFQQRNK